MSREFYMVPSYKCNSRCLMCGVFNEKKDKEWEYSFEELVDIVKGYELTDNDTVIISGGEPTIYEYLVDIIEYINRESDARVVLFTNGRKFKNKSYVKKFKNLKIDNMHIPIFGNTAEIHESMTGIKGSYKDVCEGVNNLQELSIPFSLKTVVTKINYHELSDYTQNLVEKYPSMKALSFNGIHLQGEAPKSRDLLTIQHSIAIKEVQKAMDISIEAGINTSIAGFPICLIDPYYWKNYFSPKLTETKIIAPDKDKIDNTSKKNYNQSPQKCDKCVVEEQCKWAWKMYCMFYGEEELNPIS